MSEPMNREQRRHPEKLEQLERQENPEHENPRVNPEEQMQKTDRTADDLSVRAKNSGHGKKTADKWNQ